MKNISPGSASFKVDTARLAVAWEWVLRLREDSDSQECIVAWLSWYEADERNKEAFEEMQTFWQHVDRVTEDPNPLPPKLWLGDLAEAAHGHSKENGRDETDSGRWHLLTGFKWRASLAAVALAAGICALVVIPRLPQPSVPAPTAIPAPAISSALVRDTSLPDGSHVELAAKSSISVRFTQNQRELVMQGGVAYFSVAHNPQRPFVVHVGGLDVRAVGTAFNIRSTNERVVVTVTAGTVDVYPAKANGAGNDDDGPIEGSVRIKSGSEVVWPVDGKGPTVTAVDASHALAWRQGRLDYLNEPLASAIADINRYSRRPIEIRDAAVGRIVFSGTVLTDQIDAWVQALPAFFPIDVQTNAVGDIVLVNRVSPRNERSNQTR